MFIRILQETSNEISIEIQGEGHTFCNAFQKVLLEDDTVEVAGYNIQHPLISNPILYVRTKEKREPRKALFDAVSKLQERIGTFQKVFDKALKSQDESS